MPTRLTPVQTTLADVLWPPERTIAAIRFVALALLGAALLTLAAKVKVPFYPVPMTLQTLVVALLGAVYGPRLGPATILTYIAAGAAGLPAFANTPPAVASLAYLAGPTGGYIVGWIGAAYVIGRLCERGLDRSAVTLAPAIFLGSVVTFACGVLWLAFFAAMPSGAGIGLMRAIEAGYLPFILGDILKIALATAIVRCGWTFAGRLEG